MAGAYGAGWAMRPPELRLFPGEIIIDSFAGGGGASLGIEQAFGRSPDIAVNHDAQAMALVKRFDMVIEREEDKTFGVTLFDSDYRKGAPTFVVRQEPDLNRAIVYCVAQMQARRGTASKHTQQEG